MLGLELGVGSSNGSICQCGNENAAPHLAVGLKDVHQIPVHAEDGEHGGNLPGMGLGGYRA